MSCVHAGMWNGAEEHAFFLFGNTADRYILSTVPWLSLRWHHSEEDITVTNETPQTPRWAWQGLKGQHVRVCGCKCVKVVSAEDNNTLSPQCENKKNPKNSWSIPLPSQIHVNVRTRVTSPLCVCRIILWIATLDC